jgi:hypothetical protein
MTIDKDANKKAVAIHKARKKASGKKSKTIWVDEEASETLREIKEISSYKNEDDLFKDALAILLLTMKGLV